MDFEVLASLSWREALIAVVVLLVLYLLVAFLRISRLRNENMSAPGATAHVAKSAVAAYVSVQEPEAPSEAGGSEEPSQVKGEPFPWNEPPPDTPGQRMIEALERELEQLRKEVGGLRAEVLSLREEQHRELSKAQVVQSVSPLYSDAMQMAVQGQDAAGISQLCGISRAEAELVVALVRNRDKPLD